jgi:uncharacterized RDD family membrane protein YckC
MTEPQSAGHSEPADDQPPDGQPGQGQDAGSPAAAPPPGSWHFPPQPVPPYDPAAATQPATQPYGPPGPPLPPYPEPGQQYAMPPPPPYAQQPYGAPPPPPYAQQPHGAPQQPYGVPPYGAPPQPYGTQYPPYPAGSGGPAGPEPDLAGRWRRLLARIIDGLVLSVVLIPLSIPILRRPLDHLQQVTNQYPDLSVPGAQAAIARADGKLFGAFVIFTIVAAAIVFLYDWIQHARWGQTLGKRALRTRVVTAYGRAPINSAIAARRSAVYALVPAVPLLGGLFGLLNEMWCLWDPHRQCLHDKAARTVVVRTDLPAAGNWQQPAPW